MLPWLVLVAWPANSPSRTWLVAVITLNVPRFPMVLLPTMLGPVYIQVRFRMFGSSLTVGVPTGVLPRPLGSDENDQPAGSEAEPGVKLPKS